MTRIPVGQVPKRNITACCRRLGTNDTSIDNTLSHVAMSVNSGRQPVDYVPERRRCRDEVRQGHRRGFVNDEFNDLFVAVRMFIVSLRDYPGWR